MWKTMLDRIFWYKMWSKKFCNFVWFLGFFSISSYVWEQGKDFTHSLFSISSAEVGKREGGRERASEMYPRMKKRNRKHYMMWDGWTEVGETIERLILLVGPVSLVGFLIGSNYSSSGKKLSKIHLWQQGRLFQNGVAIDTVLINVVMVLNIRVLKLWKCTKCGASFRLKVQWKNMDTPIFSATATTTHLGGNKGADVINVPEPPSQQTGHWEPSLDYIGTYKKKKPTKKHHSKNGWRRTGREQDGGKREGSQDWSRRREEGRQNAALTQSE